MLSGASRRLDEEAAVQERRVLRGGGGATARRPSDGEPPHPPSAPLPGSQRRVGATADVASGGGLTNRRTRTAGVVQASRAAAAPSDVAPLSRAHGGPDQRHVGPSPGPASEVDVHPMGDGGSRVWGGAPASKPQVAALIHRFRTAAPTPPEQRALAVHRGSGATLTVPAPVNWNAAADVEMSDGVTVGGARPAAMNGYADHRFTSVAAAPLDGAVSRTMHADAYSMRTSTTTDMSTSNILARAAAVISSSRKLFQEGVLAAPSTAFASQPAAQLPSSPQPSTVPAAQESTNPTHTANAVSAGRASYGVSPVAPLPTVHDPPPGASTATAVASETPSLEPQPRNAPSQKECAPSWIESAVVSTSWSFMQDEKGRLSALLAGEAKPTPPLVQQSHVSAAKQSESAVSKTLLLPPPTIPTTHAPSDSNPPLHGTGAGVHSLPTDVAAAGGGLPVQAVAPVPSRDLQQVAHSAPTLYSDPSQWELEPAEVTIARLRARLAAIDDETSPLLQPYLQLSRSNDASPHVKRTDATASHFLSLREGTSDVRQSSGRELAVAGAASPLRLAADTGAPMPVASHTPVHALVRRQLVLDHPADACVDVPSPPPRLDEAIQTESQVQGARVDASVVTDITASEITRELAAAFISGRTNMPTTPRTSINATTPNDAAAHVHSEPARDDPIRAVCSSTGVLMNELIVEVDTPPRTPPTRASVTVTAEDEAEAAPVSTPLSFLLSPGSSSESPVRRAPHTPKRANAPSDAYASPVNVRSTSTRECVPRISSVLATGTPPRHPSSSSSDRGAASPHNSEAQQHWQPHAMAGTHVEESGGRHAAFPAVPLFTTSASISTPTQPRDACVDALRASHASSTQSFLWDISTEAGEDDDRGFSAAELEEHVPKHDNLPGHQTTRVRTSTVAQQPDEGVHNELAPGVGTPTPQGQSVSGSEVSLFQPSTHWPLAEADSLVNMRGFMLPDAHATRPPVATTYFTRADALHGADAATRVPSSTPLPLAAPTGVLPAAAVGTVFVYAPALGAYVPVSYAPAYAVDDVTAATRQTMAVPPPPAVMKASASPPVTHPVIESRDMRATRGGVRLGQPAPKTAAAAAVEVGDGDAEHRAAGGSEPHLRTDSLLQHHTASLQASTASLASSNSGRSRATRTPAAKPPKLSLASILAPLPHVRLPLSFEGE